MSFKDAMFDLGDRLAMAQLEARVKRLQEDKLVLRSHLVDLVDVCLRVRPVSLDGIGSDDFLAAIERAQSAVGEVE